MNFLKSLFTQVRYEDYITRPHHMLYAVLMMAAGYKSMIDYNWLLFGVVLFILGILFALVIMFGIAWRGPIAYWEQIERTVQTMIKIKEPAVWQALGFKEVPDVITIKEVRTDEFGLFQGMSVKKLPIEPAMMNMIANQVLLSENLDFTEERYKDKIKNFRKVQKQFKEKGYIAPKNKRNARLGYAWTKKGLEAVYQYADESVIRLVKKKMKEGESANEE